MINYSLGALGALGALFVYNNFIKDERKQNDQTFATCCILDKIVAPFFAALGHYDSGSTLSVDAVMKDHVVLNTIDKTLYCVEISGSDNYPTFVGGTSFDAIVKNYEKEKKNYFFLALHKKVFFQKQYIFTFSEKLAKEFSDILQSPLIEGKEIINILFDLFLQNDYFISNKNIERSLNVYSQAVEKTDTEPLSVTFNKLVQNSVFANLMSTDVFQAYEGIDNTSPIDLQRLFRLDFEGVVWTYVDLDKTKISNNLASKVTRAKWSGDSAKFKDLKDNYDQGNIPLVLINSIFISKRNEKKDASNNVGQCLKFFYLDKKINKKDIIRYTPLKRRDKDFNFVVMSNFFHNYIGSVHKRNHPQADIFGYDKNKAFVNYAFGEENDNRNIVIFAPTGAGKSVAKQKMVSQIIEIDFTTGYARALGKKSLVRNFDVGKSDIKMVELLRSNPKNKVSIMGSTLDNFCYNLVSLDINVGDSSAFNDSVDNTTEADIQFVIGLTNLILETQKSEALTISEASRFRDAIREVYKKGEMHHGRIMSLEDKQPEAYAKLIELGYDRTDTFMSIKEEGFEHFKKPLLSDILSILEIKRNDSTLIAQDREAYNTLTTKLRDIDGLRIFSSYDNINIKVSDFLYMDVNEFKESQLFVPIFFSIFQKTYLKDRRIAEYNRLNNLPMKKIFYLIEEAHNFFDIPSFAQMLKKMTKEVRKYHIYLMFITQNVEDVPAAVIANIATRIFLLPEKKKDEIIKVVKTQLQPEEKVLDALKSTARHELCIWYDKGVFNMKFDFEEGELELYSTTGNTEKEEVVVL